MGALTWRNVDAPDFTPSMRGYETFSRLLDSAFGGAQAGLQAYDRDLDKTANNRILMQFAGIQDADAAKAALANLAASPDARRLNAATIGQVEGRPNALIAQALNQDNLGWNTYTHDRVKGFNTAEDAAAPLIADYYAANAAGKGAEWRAAHPGGFSGLSMAAQTQLFTGGQDARSKDLSITGQGITNQAALHQDEQGQWRFGNEKVDRSEARSAQQFIANYISSGHDGSDIDGALATSGLSGPAQMIARQLAGTAGGSEFSGSGGGSGGGGSGGGAALSGLPADLSGVNFAQVKNAIGGTESDAVGGYGALAYDTGSGRNAAGVTPPKPITSMTMGELYDFQRGAMRAKTAGHRGQGDIGSTGAGRYQFESQTLAENARQAFGDKWRDMPFTPENQDKVAETLWNRVRGNPTALGNTWAVFRNRPSAAALAIGQTTAEQGAKNQYMQQNSGSLAVPIQAAMTDTSPAVDIARKMTGKGGPLAGSNESWVMNQIQKIQTQASANGGVPISAAAAAVILHNSVRSANNDRFFSMGDTFNSNALGNNLEVNPEAIASNIAQVRSGDYQKQVVSNTMIAQRDQLIATAKSLHDQALGKLQAAQQRAANNPNFDPSILARLSIAEATTAANLAAAVGDQGEAARQAGGFGQTAAPPPPPVVAKSRPIGPVSGPGAGMPGWFGRSAGANVPAWAPPKTSPAPNLLKYYANPSPNYLIK